MEYTRCMAKRKAVFGMMVLLISAIFFVFFYSTHPAYVKTSAGKPTLEKNVFLQCESSEDKPERYDCYKQAALSAMQKGRSVKDLAQYVLDPNSHLKHHAIGRAMLITSEYNLDRAATKCMPCNGPYLHAIAEVWGEYAPSRESEFVDFLKSVCPLDGDVGCYHNLGHFYHSSNENFGASMVRCDKLQDNDRFYYCAYGVVHEQFIRSNGENFFQLCENETDRKKTACFTIGSRLYPQWMSSRIDGAYPFKPCDEVSGEIPDELNYCYASAAWVLQNKGRPLDPEQCSHLTAPLRELCQKGVQSPEPYWDVLSCSLGETSQCGLLPLNVEHE